MDEKIILTNIGNLFNIGDMLWIQALTETYPTNITIFCTYGFINQRVLENTAVDVMGFCKQGITSRLDILKVGIRALTSLIRASLRKITKCNFFLSKELKAISEHDIIVDLGGDTFTDESGVLSTLKHSYDLILMRLLDKQYIVCSHTLGPYKHVLTKFIARFLLQRALAITVRDPQSYDYLVNKLKLKDVNLYLAPDLAFAAPEKHKRKYNDNHQPSTIGLNASPTICNYMLHSVDDYTKRLHFIIELYRDLVIHLLERHGYHILLIPTVLQPLKSPFSKKPVSDVIILKAIYEELNRRGYKDKVSIVLSEDFSAIDKALSKCDIFIATRMHAGISAIRHGIPTLFLASTVKYSGVISLLGITDFIVDVRGRNDISQLKEEIVSKVEKIITNYNHVRRTFEEFSKKATISARLHIEVIKKAKILSYFKEVPCYGCGTCVAACPTSALTLVINNHGCYRPWLDPLKCTTCKACLKVCPAISRR